MAVRQDSSSIVERRAVVISKDRQHVGRGGSGSSLQSSDHLLVCLGVLLLSWLVATALSPRVAANETSPMSLFYPSIDIKYKYICTTMGV